MASNDHSTGEAPAAPGSGLTRLAARAPLPDGTVIVAVGLLVAGVASLLYLKLAQSAVGSKEALQPVSTLWFAIFALAPGFFLPVEQELARALAHRRARGEGGRPVVSKVIRLCAALGALVTVVVLALSPAVVHQFFQGNWWMVVSLVLAFACYAPAHLARGIASGTGRFGAYSAVMAGDGVVRILGCLLLWAAGVKAIGPYGLVIGLSPLPVVLFVWWRKHLQTADGPVATWHEVTPKLGWLLMGSAFAATLINAGPLAAGLLASKLEHDRVTNFGFGVLIARVPLFLFQAVQAALLPRLARLAARHQLREFRSGLNRLLGLVAGVAVLGTAGAYVFGPWIARKFFKADLSRNTMVMLALGSAIYMFALALAQAVIALRGHAMVALGWGVGMVTLVLGVWLSSTDLFRRIEIGLVLSSLASLVAFWVALRALLARNTVPEPEDVLTALTDVPFEG